MGKGKKNQCKLENSLGRMQTKIKDNKIYGVQWVNYLKIYSCNVKHLHLRFQISNLTSYLKKLEKDEQTKSKDSRIKISETKRKTIEKN